jgi:uncharacterized protein DUF6894
VPRYFFNVVEGNSKNLLRDSEGTVFSDLGGARKEAVAWAQDFARHDFPESIQTWRVLVTDENADVVLTVPLSEVRLCKMTRAWLELVRHITRLESSFGSRIVVWLVAAAMLIVIVQASLKTASVTEMSGNYHLASASIENVVVAVRFVPNARLVDITEFLDVYKSTLVDGPDSGGFYRLRIAKTTLPQNEIATIVNRMAQEKVVEFAAVVQ